MHSARSIRLSGSAGAAALYACSVSTPSAQPAVPEDSHAKPHHVKGGKGFKNPWDSYKDYTPASIASAFIWRKISGVSKTPDTTPPIVPVLKPLFLESRTGNNSLRATWLGHACHYVEFPNGLRVLFDPVFEDRCSPFTHMGPKRITPAPCKPSEIPIVDVVVISHSHYDHLSHPTILEIQKAHPNVLFAVPLGLKKWIQECGIKNTVELDWWQDIDISLIPHSRETQISKDSASSKDLSITARLSCLPAQHTSARTLFDKDTTLWASWAVSAGGKNVWFGGDTGYRTVPQVPQGVDDYGPEYAHLPRCPAFKEIGELRGPFDLGLIPIGAYDPRHLFSHMHANPFDSVEIFADTKCKKAMGIHYATWVLTEEEVKEPPVLLKQALKRKGLPEVGVFDICHIGESREF